MVLTLPFSPEEAARLRDAAKQEGVDLETYVRKIVNEHLPPRVPDEESDPTLKLLAQWEVEDGRMTPEEVEAAQQDFEEFKRQLNAERTKAGARLLYP
jgi:hypothetical protein